MNNVSIAAAAGSAAATPRRVVNPYSGQGVAQVQDAAADRSEISRGAGDLAVPVSSTAAPSRAHSSTTTRLVALGLAGLAAMTVGVTAANAAGWGPTPTPPATSVVIPQQYGTHVTGGWGGGSAQPAPGSFIPLPQSTHIDGSGWATAGAVSSVQVQASYSPIGQLLAKGSLENAKNAKQNNFYNGVQQADAMLKSGLDAIATNPISSPAEKALAQLSNDVASRPGMTADESFTARAAVAQIIADQSAQGTIPQVLAKATVAAYNAVGQANDLFNKVQDQSWVLNQGLKTIASNPAYGGDAVIAQLGQKLAGHHSNYDYQGSDALQYRVAALDEIATPSGANVGNRLAVVTQKVFDEATQSGIVDWGNARQVAEEGLSLIKSSPVTSIVQKSLATVALNAPVNTYSINGDQQTAQQRDSTVQLLRTIQ